MEKTNLFTEHPATVGETYLEHFGCAARFGGRMVLAGCACLLHGLLPFLFTRTGSRTIAALHDEMCVNRDRRTARAAAETPAPTVASAARAAQRA